MRTSEFALSETSSRKSRVARSAVALAAVGLAASACTSGVNNANSGPPAKVELSAGPAKLPKFITDAESTVNQIIAEEPKRQSNGKVIDSGGAEYGSGLFVSLEGQTIEVAAAHVAGAAGGYCASDIINAVPNGKGSNYYGVVQQSRADVPPSSMSTHYDPSYNGGSDVTVQIVNPKQAFTNNVLSQDAVQSTTSELAPGTEVVAVNYEGLSNGQTANPHKQGPTVFEMTTIGSTENDYVAIEGEGRSYGADHRNVSKPGASGGPVFAGNALIGLTVSSGEEESAKQLLDNYNVIVPNGDYFIEDIAPVSQDLLENDLNDATSSQQCPVIP